MAYSLEFKQKAINFRKKGHSIKEVSDKLGIAKGTSSLWLRNVPLGKKALRRLKKRKMIGQFNAHLTHKRKRLRKKHEYFQKAKTDISGITLDRNGIKLLCSFLFWAEGGKTTGDVTFVNSDPQMISTFLFLLRKCFPIDESKFRVTVHVHEYHNERKIRKFWSALAKIPLSQFTKSYQKPHTGKRKRQGYKGCIRIRYYDARVAHELHAFYNMYAKELTKGRS